MTLLRPARWAVAALLLSGAGCFGHSIVRPDPLTLVENLGSNRYTYHLTKLVQVPAREPAAPIVGVAPTNAREVGMIEIAVEYGGSGTGGLRSDEAEFFPRLAALAGEMGGTHFMVVRKSNESRAGLGNWIATMTVDVLDVPPPR